MSGHTNLGDYRKCGECGEYRKCGECPRRDDTVGSRWLWRDDGGVWKKVNLRRCWGCFHQAELRRDMYLREHRISREEAAEELRQYNLTE